MGSTSKRPAARAKRKSRPLAFPVEFRLRIEKLYLEEGYSRKLLVEQFGISTHSIQRWVEVFRLHGAAGLELKRPVTRKSRVPDEVRHQAVAVKEEHPEYGPRRISDVLALFLHAHQPRHGSQDPCCAGAREEGPCQGGEEPPEAAVF